MIEITEERWERFKEQICDDYCFFAVVSRGQDVLDQHCESCPLNTITEPLGYCPHQE